MGPLSVRSSCSPMSPTTKDMIDIAIIATGAVAALGTIYMLWKNR